MRDFRRKTRPAGISHLDLRRGYDAFLLHWDTNFRQKEQQRKPTKTRPTPTTPRRGTIVRARRRLGERVRNSPRRGAAPLRPISARLAGMARIDCS